VNYTDTLVAQDNMLMDDATPHTVMPLTQGPERAHFTGQPVLVSYEGETTMRVVSNLIPYYTGWPNKTSHYQ